MKTMRLLKSSVPMAAGLLLMAAASDGTADPVMFKLLQNFGSNMGISGPGGHLLLANDGLFYGPYDGSGVYRMDSYGVASSVSDAFYVEDCSTGGSIICSPAGENPSSLVQASDGNFYGTADQAVTIWTPPPFAGAVFQLKPSGQVTYLHDFNPATEGIDPLDGLVEGSDGRLYGAANAGGASNQGTVFAVAPTGPQAGQLTVLHTFSGLNVSGGNADGAAPAATVILGKDGNFYGTTSKGGTYGGGTIFKITPSGGITTLHSFNSGPDGANPQAALLQGSDGNFYGTATNGGSSGEGTVFRITPAGKFTTLHSLVFDDGINPSSPLVEAKNGTAVTFYGTTPSGGGVDTNSGTIFSVTSNGQFNVIYTFTASYDNENVDGESPNGLTVGSEGDIYGTASAGGIVGGGTAFKYFLNIPTVSINFDESNVEVDQPVTLTWSSTSAVGCAATGNGWSDPNKATFGSTVIKPTAKGTFNYKLTCSNPLGSAKGTATLTVTKKS